MKTTTLTKEEFITRSMAGEVFINNGSKLFYDPTKTNPFRIGDAGLGNSWSIFDGKTVFRVKAPVERRWRWRRDNEGFTSESNYMTEECAVERGHTPQNGWYKVENIFIDVNVHPL